MRMLKQQVADLESQLAVAKEGIQKSREYTDLLSEVDVLRHKSTLLDVSFPVSPKRRKC